MTRAEFVAILVMLAGEFLGFWVANGRAEQRILQIFLLITIVVMADELKSLVLDMVLYFKKKDSSK